jgi:hypothetical protein
MKPGKLRALFAFLMDEEVAFEFIDPRSDLDDPASLSSSTEVVSRNFHSPRCSWRGSKAMAVNYFRHSLKVASYLEMNVTIVVDNLDLLRRLSIRVADNE